MSASILAERSEQPIAVLGAGGEDDVAGLDTTIGRATVYRSLRRASTAGIAG